MNFTDDRGSVFQLPIPFTPQEILVSTNTHAGTLRGLHYEVEPHARWKLVYCIRGRLWDVGVQLATGLVTSVVLSPGREVCWAPDMAHGFVTLEPDTEIVYLMSKRFEPDSARGIRWDDPKVGVRWPVKPIVMSERDKSWPLL